MVRTFILMAVMLCAAVANAQNDSRVILVPSVQTVQAHERFIFSIYIHNSGDETITTDLPHTVTCRLSTTDQQATAAARATTDQDASRFDILPRSFIERQYAATLPDAPTGTVELSVDEIDAETVLITMVSGTPPESDSPPDEQADQTEEYTSLDSLFTLYQPYLANISAYEPIYFLVGTDPKNSKFQISLKYQFFSEKNPAGAKFPWLRGIHFAYTQTSFWDLGSVSAPFEDTSYKPELFYLTGNMRNRLSWLKGFYFQSGLQHESNGRAGDESRGANTIYAKPIFIFYNEGSRIGFMVAPKFWAYFDREQDTNQDLPDYRGYFDLEMKFGWAESIVLGSNLRWASEGPSVQLDFTYPLHKISFNTLEIYFQAQYFNGYAESLLNYNEHSSALRFGLAIVR